MKITKSSPWDNPELLELNRLRLLRDAQEELRRCEARYGIRSDELKAALDAGEITETDDVGRWLFAIHTYHSMSRE